MLHVSNLTRNINEDHLYEIFGTFAEVIDVHLAIDDKVNLPKGYAHITLPNKEAAKDAIYHLHHAQIDGNIINIRFAHKSGENTNNVVVVDAAIRRGVRDDDDDSAHRLPLVDTYKVQI
ncbi:ribonucleic acid binding protein S1, putative [Perkinsus marinus ATCC 50983]|uniref:Ribonucleic acid binding protein S1, putative n=1 Tax=Perkinsus marinus (strain ATCC 50983 / TXsc) TaxID=423536 RepID=C5L6P6_PERM5|nr:ribonucleic acid binding protein S1, putative [Perkinsus marinus ATCC 50983]EER07598.1 ribonucleic acid binding protein S1, putative [Perkinsus marinus ATCC 50983]|eukprot:XP_002775782.1 ribonucleic acid binding protein S1, putative [Perkinsus marinus ATCC 50983]